MCSRHLWAVGKRAEAYRREIDKLFCTSIRKKAVELADIALSHTCTRLAYPVPPNFLRAREVTMKTIGIVHANA